MKRFLLLAIAVAFTFLWIAPSFALDASFDGQYRIRAISMENTKDVSDETEGDADSWIDQRFRLGITIKEAPVTGYVQLQLGDHTTGGYNDSHTWGTGSGENFEIQVRQAYLDFPIGPLQFRVGRSYASHGFLAGGMFENIADRYIVTYKVNPEFVVSFVHAKAVEGSAGTATGTRGSTGAIDTDYDTANDNDKNIYNLGFTYKPEGANYDVAARLYYVRDGGGYISSGGTVVSNTSTKNTTVGEWDAWWLTAQGNLKINPVNIYLSGAYLTGESDYHNKTKAGSVENLDIDGYALHAEVNATFGPAKIGLQGGLGSGDSDTGDKDLETFFAPAGASYVHTHLMLQNGENTYAPTIAAYRPNVQNGSTETLSNLKWAGIYADYKVNDDLTVGAKVADFWQTEKIDSNNNDDEIGVEYDLTVNYRLHKGLTLLAFAAWFDPQSDTITTTDDEDLVSEYYARLQWDF